MKLRILSLFLLLYFNATYVLEISSLVQSIQSNDKSLNLALFLPAKANQSSLLEYLLNAHPDINPNFANYKGNTALHEAAKAGSLQAAKLLVQAGATADIKNKMGKTALDLAKENGNEQMICLLKNYHAKDALQDASAQLIDVAQQKETLKIAQNEQSEPLILPDIVAQDAMSANEREQHEQDQIFGSPLKNDQKTTGFDSGMREEKEVIIPEPMESENEDSAKEEAVEPILIAENKRITNEMIANDQINDVPVNALPLKPTIPVNASETSSAIIAPAPILQPTMPETAPTTIEEVSMDSIPLSTESEEIEIAKEEQETPWIESAQMPKNTINLDMEKISEDKSFDVESDEEIVDVAPFYSLEDAKQVVKDAWQDTAMAQIKCDDKRCYYVERIKQMPAEKKDERKRIAHLADRVHKIHHKNVLASHARYDRALNKVNEIYGQKGLDSILHALLPANDRRTPNQEKMNIKDIIRALDRAYDAFYKDTKELENHIREFKDKIKVLEKDVTLHENQLMRLERDMMERESNIGVQNTDEQIQELADLKAEYESMAPAIQALKDLMQQARQEEHNLFSLYAHKEKLIEQLHLIDPLVSRTGNILSSASKEQVKHLHDDLNQFNASIDKKVKQLNRKLDTTRMVLAKAQEQKYSLKVVILKDLMRAIEKQLADYALLEKILRGMHAIIDQNLRQVRADEPSIELNALSLKERIARELTGIALLLVDLAKSIEHAEKELNANASDENKEYLESQKFASQLGQQSIGILKQLENDRKKATNAKEMLDAIKQLKQRLQEEMANVQGQAREIKKQLLKWIGNTIEKWAQIKNLVIQAREDERARQKKLVELAQIAKEAKASQPERTIIKEPMVEEKMGTQGRKGRRSMWSLYNNRMSAVKNK